MKNRVKTSGKKLAALTVLLVTMALANSGCARWSDFQANVLSGTLNFVEDSTQSVWGALLPIEDWV